MEHKGFLFAVVPLVGIIFIFSYLNVNQENAQLQGTSNSDLCQSIEYNGLDRIDILFISDEEDAKHYSDVLLNTEPYRSYRNYFNSYVISEKDPKCEYYKGIALFCNTQEIKSLAKNCPNDYVVVIKEDSPQIRSSAYGNLISINKVHEDSVLVHEFGHAFGNLAEEYTGAKIPPLSNNCVSSCNKFNGQTDSCDMGCSESDYYRSIYEGVMRTLKTSNYGIYNANLLSKALEKNKPKETLITGNPISESEKCNDQLQMVKLFPSEEGVIVEVDNNLEIGCAPDKGTEGALCVGEVCNVPLMFTDSQDLNEEDTIQGEVFTPEQPIISYIRQNTQNPLVEITYNKDLIKIIDTSQAGATACRI